MKRILLLSLVFLLFITPFAYANDGTVYENHDYKFRITLPDKWNAKVTNGCVELSYKVIPSISVFTIPISNLSNDESSFEYMTNILYATLGHDVKEQGKIHIANQDAHWFLFVRKNSPSHIFAYLFEGKNVAFQILVMDDNGFNDIDKDREICEKILSTFEILED